MPSYEKKQAIKLWAEDDRPREKLLLKGKQALSDAELIAILIATGNTEESAVDLAQRILNTVDGNLIELSKLTVKDLTKFKGIGLAKAITIIAALEIGRRRREAEVLQKKQIITSKDAYEIFQSTLSDSNYEQFWVLLLNRAQKLIRKVNISEGGMTGTVADPKKIFKIALDQSACSIILGHNHPSGNLNPSEQDIKLTQKMKKSGELLEISVLDHIIVGDNNYFSFADEGLM
ncbi:MAG: DNA repair protein RadC [Bacteroidales bacterium]|nr:DNA repair protein RadC [Bacteroidales bacterium]MDZ4203567.1 DNA repair protein RadC [Bacteroidales bacterium]